MTTMTARAARMFGVKRPDYDPLFYVRDTARLRGEIYLERAQMCLNLNDRKNALATAEEGLRLAQFGQGYLAIREQLRDLIQRVKAAD